MPALMPTEFTATITWIGRVTDRERTLRSAPLPEVFASFAGVEGEEHAGLTRPSCSRVSAQHPRGTTIPLRVPAEIHVKALSPTK